MGYNHVELLTKLRPELVGIANSGLDPTSKESADTAACMIKYVNRMFDVASKSCVKEGLGLSNHSLSFRELQVGGSWVHLGGDEAVESWNNAAIKAYMKDKGMSSLGELGAQFYSNVINGLDNSSRGNEKMKRMVFWEDMVALPEFASKLAGSLNHNQGVEIVAQVWQTSWKDLIDSGIVKQQLPVIYSTDFYLDHLGKSWTDFYDRSLDIAASCSSATGRSRPRRC